MERILLSILCGVVACSDDSSTDTNNTTNNPTNNATNNSTNSATNNPTNNATNNKTNNQSDDTIDLSQFSQTCESDQDCKVVSAHACGCGDEAAISYSSFSAYLAEKEQVECPPLDAPCDSSRVASCSGGTCTSREEVIVAVEDYDRSCQTSADCRVIPLGEVCDPCPCDYGAVNANDYAMNGPSQLSCNRGQVACEACTAPEPMVSCTDNVCETVDTL